MGADDYQEVGVTMTCQGILGRLFGHKYRPRYDVKDTKPAVGEFYSGPVGEFRCTYVCDVCVRCGATIKKEATDGQEKA